MAQEVIEVIRHKPAMILERKLAFEGSQGRAELLALFDSGATYSCIRPDFATAIARLEPLPRPLDVETASAGHIIRITDRVSLDFYLDNLRLTDEFLVVPGLSEEAIIGATTMQKWKIKLDFEQDKVITDPRAARVRLIGIR
jgi:hypothetical protein